MENQRNNTAVIYARFSSHAQTEQSIEGQLHVCYDYARREGLNVVGEYIDRAITGKTDNRPDFQRMIADSRKKAFQYVIVYKLDRFARNRYDSAIYKHKLKQNGVKLLSAMENIGDNPESIILEAVLEASAEYYSVDLSQKIKRGSRESALKGRFLGGSIPLGYKLVDHHLAIDEREAPIVQYIFKQYAAGMRKKEIVDALNSRGARTKNGKPFTFNSFQSALRNRTYIGEHRWNDVIIPCPAIIDEETFQTVQLRLDENRRRGAKEKAIVEYLLSGKVFCGNCGSAMTGLSGTGRHGGKFYYYTCYGRRKKNGCQKKNEKKDFLEWFVCEQTVQYVLSPDRIKKIAKAVVEEYNKEFDDSAVKDLERRIAKLDKDIDKYTDMLLDIPKAARERIYQKIEDADLQKQDLEIDLSKLRIASKIRYTEKDIAAWLKTFCNGDLFDNDFRRRLIDVFINSVYVYDDRIIIFYNVRGGKQTSYISPGTGGTGESPENEEKANPQNGVCFLNGMVEHNVQKTNPLFVFVGGVLGVIFCR